VLVWLGALLSAARVGRPRSAYAPKKTGNRALVLGFDGPAASAKFLRYFRKPETAKQGMPTIGNDVVTSRTTFEARLDMGGGEHYRFRLEPKLLSPLEEKEGKFPYEEFLSESDLTTIILQDNVPSVVIASGESKEAGKRDGPAGDERIVLTDGMRNARDALKRSYAAQWLHPNGARAGGGNPNNDHKEDAQRNSKKHKKGLVDEGDEGKTRTSEEEAGQPNQTGGGGNRPVIPLQTEGDMDLH
jgi:hypothetical protein